MDLIKEFIARYTKEYDFYFQAGRLARLRLEEDLQAAGVRVIVTDRAKSISRLEAKCRQREKMHVSYSTVDQIFEDIVDLAGVRVALYFPAERAQVDGAINRIFNVISKKEFPDLTKTRLGKRFSGYSAVHYRVQLKEDDLSESEKRYAVARIEIQVASVLMHAWAEVEHDLVYKPLTGDLSDDEYAILDELNGLVLAGEIALERLQKGGEVRVNASGRRITNHYELAVHLRAQAADLTSEPVSEAGLGRVDLLFDLMAALGIDTPERLAPYLDALHGNVEARPLAEQVIDALISEDKSRYEIYSRISERRRAVPYEESKEDSAYRQFGLFIARWVELEQLLQDAIRAKVGETRRPYIVPMARELVDLGLLDPEMAQEYDRIRRLRNELTHGRRDLLSSTDVTDAIGVIKMLMAQVNRRRGEGTSEGQETT